MLKYYILFILIIFMVCYFKTQIPKILQNVIYFLAKNIPFKCKESYLTIFKSYKLHRFHERTGFKLVNKTFNLRIFGFNYF